MLKAGAAKNWPALSGLEGNRRRLTTLGAVGPRFGTNPRSPADALRLALFAMLGIVLEFFVVEEQLFACGKDELGAAIEALQNSVDKFHGRLPQRRELH